MLLLPFKFYNIKIRPRLLGHLTNFCTNFYEFFLISENSLKFANFFAEVTNSRSMYVISADCDDVASITTCIIIAFVL